MSKAHPALLNHYRFRTLEERLADTITAFAGSMTFAYLHAVVFAFWCVTGLFGVDPFPYNFLTLAVSLEAIFLSTFVMIGQNRATERDRLVLNHDAEVTDSIATLVRELHSVAMKGNVA